MPQLAPHQRLQHIGRQLRPLPISAGQPITKLLVANRGEIACRVIRAAKALGIRTVALHSVQDAGANHTLQADEVYLILPPGGEAAALSDPIGSYLNIDAVIDIAKRAKCDGVHPGYGFLAENPSFCAQCVENGITFVGPSESALRQFGDKDSAKRFAIAQQVPVAQGSGILSSAKEARLFIEGSKVQFPILIKAVHGGGGRGQRVVRKMEQLEEAFAQCVQEAELSFGNGAVFIEEFLEKARHIEVQILCDMHGAVSHLYERDCSVQQRNQKVVEIAPARGIANGLRERLTSSALALARGCNYSNAGTVEFLVLGELSDDSARYIFLEVNPRIQVEHTITEEVTGVDIVQAQLKIAQGVPLTDILPLVVPILRSAMQLRITLTAGGASAATSLSAYHEPVGDGIRVDSGVRAGGPLSQAYDPMIAKLICSAPFTDPFEMLIKKSLSALDAYTIEGANVNKEQLHEILEHPDFAANNVFTSFIASLEALKKQAASVGGGVQKIVAPFAGKVEEVKVKIGDTVEAGDTLLVISAMKMLNNIVSDFDGEVVAVTVAPGQQLAGTEELVEVRHTGQAVSSGIAEVSVISRKAPAVLSMGSGSSPYIQKGKEHEMAVTSHVLQSKVKHNDVFEKRYAANAEKVATLNQRLDIVRERPAKAMEKLRSKGKFLPRERIGMCIDAGTELLELTPLAAWGRYGGTAHSAGIVTGIGLVHGREVMFVASDSTINGGAMYGETGKKFARAQTIAMENRLPCVYLIDGGGANLSAGTKSGDKKKSDDKPETKKEKPPSGPPSAMFLESGDMFYNTCRLSQARIPQISVATGNCTAGAAYNVALCDEVIMVKENGTVYLAGPPLVKAATGETCDHEELGGAAMHSATSGVSDHFVENEEEAFRKVRAIIEYLGAPARYPIVRQLSEEPLYDMDEILGILPENTNIPFDVRDVVARITDGSRFHEFKPRYGPTLVCGFGHIAGYPVGLLGNNGMLFSESSLKGAHFIQMCGQRGIPLVFLQNISGFIVGVAHEQQGITKHGAKLIMAVSCVSVPKFCVVMAGSHGAGTYAMCSPAFHPRLTFCWPGAKICVMGGEQAAEVMRQLEDKSRARQGTPLLTEEEASARKAPIIRSFEATATAWDSTASVCDDGIIDPRSTRDVLAKGLAMALNNTPGAQEQYGIFRQ